jgi:uncharacterized delta-60 repeat protein
VFPDGSVASVGNHSNISGRGWTVRRLLPDGTPDLNFGTNGRVETDLGEAYPQDLLALPNGDVLVAGEVVTDDEEVASIVLVRYRPDGSPDPGFGGDGVRIVMPTRLNLVSLSLAAGPEGTFLVDQTLQSWRNLYISTRVARFLDDGTFDQTFGGHGRTHLGRGRELPLLAVDGGGRIVLGGAVTPVSRAGHGASVSFRWAVLRLLSDGSPDPAFGTGGWRTSRHADTEVRAMIADDQGRVTMCLTSPRGVVRIDRLRQDGALDRSFANGGELRLRFPPDVRLGLFAPGPGRTFVVGVTILEPRPPYHQGILTALAPGGGRDRKFGHLGRLALGPLDLFGGVVAPDGHVLVVGGGRAEHATVYRTLAVL